MIATLAYAGFAGWTLREIRNSAIDTHNLAEAARSQAAQAQEQTAKMHESNEINRAGLIGVQRSFVYLSNFTVIFPNPRSQRGEKEPLFQAEWRNAGNTPATSVTQYVNWDSRKGLLPRGFTYPDKPLEGNIAAAPTKFYIAPHDAIRGSILRVPRAQLETLGSGTFVHLWGWVKYTDVFSCFHKSEFCMRVIGFNQQTNQVLMTACPEHNCADTDCPDYKPSDLLACRTGPN